MIGTKSWADGSQQLSSVQAGEAQQLVYAGFVSCQWVQGDLVNLVWIFFASMLKMTDIIS